MDRRRADRLAVVVVGAVAVLGALWTWDSYQARRTFEDGMGGSMGSMMDGMGMTWGPDPLAVAVGTLVVAGALAGGYLFVRDELPSGRSEADAGAAGPAADDLIGDADSPDFGSAPVDPSHGVTDSRQELLDLLPADERRILEPVLESPGLTQIELRDRAEFSKSKVSQTVSALEQRGLLYREKQGRTYRVYPDERLGKSR